jgi:UDP-glucose 4-epimerase
LILKNKCIIVTGGAGFIGSNLVRALEKYNTVKVIDNLSTGYLKNIKDLINNTKIEFIKGNITNLNFLQKTFKDVDYIFHLAAIPSVPRSIINPIKSNHANINGTLNVLIAAKDNNVKKVIYSSSSSVYGDTPTLPKKEDMKPCPLSPYAVSKLTSEYYCQVFTEVYYLPTICLRYFNVYGPHQDKKSEYAAVIPKFITSVLNNNSPVIFGNGKQTRDFTFVKDAVNANILAAKSKETGVFNIAYGKRISINKLAKSIMDIIGKQIKPKYTAPRSGDILHSLADISKAKRKLGYIPKIEIKEGLEETITWFQKQI